MSDRPEPDWHNMGRLCPKHAREKGGFTDVPRGHFLGKHVQLGFDTGLEDGPKQENMWVEVADLTEIDGIPALEGKLANTPAFCDLSLGDVVQFTTDEILQAEPDGN